MLSSEALIGIEVHDVRPPDFAMVSIGSHGRLPFSPSSPFSLRWFEGATSPCSKQAFLHIAFALSWSSKKVLNSLETPETVIKDGNAEDGLFDDGGLRTSFLSCGSLRDRVLRTGHVPLTPSSGRLPLLHCNHDQALPRRLRSPLSLYDAGFLRYGGPLDPGHAIKARQNASMADLAGCRGLSSSLEEDINSGLNPLGQSLSDSAAPALTMPSVPPGSKVLVTGGNGYVGAWVIHTLLAQGFSVRAVVRSEDKAKPLQQHFSVHDHDEKVKEATANGRLELVYVADFVKEGAFDGVMEGVEAILHLASPLPTGNGPADDFILPAVNGTRNLLRAASLPSSSVKRFVYCSSTATVSRPVTPPSPSDPALSEFRTVVFDENDWGIDVQALKEAQEKGEDAPFMVKYRASKTLAERAAWDWVKEKKGEIGWDLVVLNPPIVLGPPLIRALPLVTSVEWWFRVVIKGEYNPKPELLDYRSPFSYVDVRDFAQAHINALIRDEAGGERVIVAAGALTWQQAINTANTLYPILDRMLKAPPTKGVEGSLLEPLSFRYNAEKSQKVLGLGYKSFEETVKDMLIEFTMSLSEKHEKDLARESIAEKAEIESHSERVATPDIDPQAEARLVRKLDFVLLPLFTAICNARVAGLEKDLGMHGTQLNVALTIFYLCYLISDIPSNLLLKRYGSTWLALLVIGFGVVSLASAFLHNFAGLVVSRVFLGLTEGGTLSALLYIVARYYRRHEYVFRVGIFFGIAPSISGAFGGLIASGLLRVSDIGSVRSWRKIFLVEGLITTVFGLILLFFVPEDPSKSKLLTAEERALAVARIDADRIVKSEGKLEKTTWKLVWRSFNIMTISCTICFMIINMSFQGLSLWLPSVINNLGTYSVVEVQLRTVPPYIVGAVWAVANSWVSYRTRVRWLPLLVSTLLAVAGYGISVGTHNTQARYAACFLNIMAGAIIGPMLVIWGTDNAAPDTMRAVVTGAIPGFGAVGSIMAVWTYIYTDAPEYRRGNLGNLATMSLMAVIIILTAVYLRWENAKRERGERDYRLEGKTEEEVKNMGYRHPQFRYQI
ncbi:hypothetical protein NMY22_g7119 [Coprinellus aureogranulatus]|nr:hypothetical protein NMY22_g7119 [Coprinellus aureogranulatus]